MEPLDGDQWAETSTREGLIAELRECREENARLRELLHPIWHRTHAETFRLEIPDDRWFKVGMTAWQLRQIAALFTEEEDDDQG